MRLVRSAVATGLISFSGQALTQDTQGSAVTSGGFGAWIIDSLFEAGSVSNIAQEPGLIGTVIMPLSLMCMVVAVAIITLKSVQHLLVVAQAKDPSASPISLTWAPLHLIIAVALIMPMPSGYSLGQYAAIWVAQQSNLLGNVTQSRATAFIRERGAITAPPMPSMQEFVDGVVMSNVCKTMFNYHGDFMENMGADRVIVNSMLIPEARIAELSFTKKEGFRSEGITYAKTRTHGYTNEAAGLNDFCGSLLIGFKEAPDGERMRSFVPQFVSDPEECEGNNFCAQSATSIRNSTAEIMASVNTSFMETLLSHGSPRNGGNSSAGPSIAQNLLYDVPTYLGGTMDRELSTAAIEMQAQEEERIQIAVDQTVQLYNATRNQMFAMYAEAINRANRESNNGDDWLEVIDRAGWPMLGLYWFQMTNTSREVLKASSIHLIYNGDIDSFMTNFESQTQDKALALRLRNRFQSYSSKVHAAIQNTRNDSQPLVNEMRDSSGRTTGVTADLLRESNAYDIRKNLPSLLDSFTSLAAEGSLNPTGSSDSVMQIVNTWSRETVFPLLINSLRQGDMVTSLVNTGHNIIMVSEAIYGAQVWLEAMERAQKARIAQDGEDDPGFIDHAVEWMSGTGFVNSFNDFAARSTFFQMFFVVFEDFAAYWKYVFFLGLFLAFYLPAMIMIQWLIGLVTWIIYLIEATVVIPAWGLLFVSDMGEKSFSPQTARQGFIHLLSILLYPSLMVIGFIIGLKVIDLISGFLVEYLLIGFLNSTEGYAFGIISFVMGLFIIGLASYQIILRVFSIVLEFNDRAMSWIGQRMGYNESNMEHQVRGGMMAIINEGKMHNRGNKTPATQKPNASA